MPLGQLLPARGTGFWAEAERDRASNTMILIDLNMVVLLCMDRMAQTMRLLPRAGIHLPEKVTRGLPSILEFGID